MKLTLFRKEVHWLQQHHAGRIRSIEARSNPEFLDVEFRAEVTENEIWEMGRSYQLAQILSNKTLNPK